MAGTVLWLAGAPVNHPAAAGIWLEEEPGCHRCTGTGSGIHSAASLTKTIQIRLSAVFIMVGVANYWTSRVREPRSYQVYYRRVFITSRGGVQWWHWTEICCTDLQYENMRKTGRAATRSCDVGDNLSSAADDMSRHLDLQSAVRISAWRARDKNSILAIFIQLRSAAGCKTIKLHLPGTKQRGRRDVQFIVISRPKVGAG